MSTRIHLPSRSGTLQSAAAATVHAIVMHAATADRDALLTAHERRARIRELTDRLAKIDDDLIPTAESVDAYGWLDALWSERRALLDELKGVA